MVSTAVIAPISNIAGQSYAAPAIVNPQFLKFLLSQLSHGDIPISEAGAAEGQAQARMFMRQCVAA